MVELLTRISNGTLLLFVVTCMVAAGLGLTVRDVIAPFRRLRTLAIALLANFLAVPIVAVLLTRFFPIAESYKTGLLLLAGAAGAPFLPKLAALAGGDRAYSVGLMLLLMVCSVVFLPVAAPLLIPGLSADPWSLFRPLLFTMLIPLLIGMLIKHQFESRAIRLQASIGLLSNISMAAAVILLIGLNFDSLLKTFGTGAAAIGAVFVGLSTGIGYILGGPAPQHRSVLGVGTGQRNVAAALLLATEQYAQDSGVAIMVLVTTISGAIVLILASRRMARLSSPTLTEPNRDHAAVATPPLGGTET